MVTTNDYKSTKVITGKVRFSYLHAFEPVKAEGSDTAKYSVSLIIDKKDKKTLDAVNAAINVAKEALRMKSGGKIPATAKFPLRDGDEKDDEAYKGSYYLTASSITRPGIVDRNRQPIIDPEEIYSGCYGLASINFYPFAKPMSCGVACGLNNLLKLSDGDPLGGRCSAENDFADAQIPVDDDDDLM